VEIKLYVIGLGIFKYLKKMRMASNNMNEKRNILGVKIH